MRFYHEFFIFRSNNEEKIFSKIYKNNYWGSNFSKSGPGSDLDNTVNIRKKFRISLKNTKLNLFLMLRVEIFYG